MDNNKSPPSVAPPVYAKADPHQDVLPPYHRNDENRLASPARPLAHGYSEDGTANPQKEPAVAARIRKKRFCIVGSLLLLAIIIAATASGGYYAKKANERGRFVAVPSKTGIQPDSRGPPVVALADGSNHRMSSYSNGISNDEFWIWHVSNDGELARKRSADANRTAWDAEEWEAADSKRFLTAPVLASDGTQGTGGLALALEASTGALLSCYANAPYEWMQNCFWENLGGRFTTLPIALSAGFHLAQVHAVNENGQLWRRRMKTRSTGNGEWPGRPTWFDWELVGAGFAGELSTYYLEYPDGTLRVAAVRHGTYQVLDTGVDTESWPEVWEDYGRPPLCAESLGSPKLFSIGWKHVAILGACDGKLWHRAVTNTQDTAWHLLEAPGGEHLTHSPHAQTLPGQKRWAGKTLREGLIITPYLVSRTRDRCYHATVLLQGNETVGAGAVRGAPWQRLWCPTPAQEGLATALACSEGLEACYMYREDADGRILRAASEPLTFLNGSMTAALMELTWESLEGRLGQ